MQGSWLLPHLYLHPLWSGQKMDETWKLTLSFHKVNQVATSTAVASPDVIASLGLITRLPRTWYEATDLANSFFPSCLSRRNTGNNLLSTRNAISILPSLDHNLGYWHLDHLSLPPGITLGHKQMELHRPD